MRSFCKGFFLYYSHNRGITRFCADTFYRITRATVGRLKRLLALSLAAVLAAGLLSGCEPDGNTGDSEKVRIRIWTIATPGDGFHDPFVKAIEDYNRTHADCEVVMTTFENQLYKEKLQINMAGDELPDIFYTWGGGFSQGFVESGKVLAIDSYYDKYADELPQAALVNCTYDGKLYGVTYVTPVSLVFYSKKAFAEAGVSIPTTYDELLDCCEKLKEAGYIPIGNSVKDSWVLAMLHDGLTLKSVGPERLGKVLTGEEGSYDSEDFITASKAMETIIDKRYMARNAAGLTNDQSVAMFYEGKSAMYITGSWLAGGFYEKRGNEYANVENPEDFDCFPLPVINPDNAKITDYMGGAADTLMVARSTNHPDKAAEVAFELARSVSKYAYLSGAGVPAWKVDYDDSEVPPMPKKVALLAGNATTFTLWFDTLMTSENKTVYLDLICSLYQGSVSPEELCRRMAEQLGK